MRTTTYAVAKLLREMDLPDTEDLDDLLTTTGMHAEMEMEEAETFGEQEHWRRMRDLAGALLNDVDLLEGRESLKG